jgi:carbamoyl-phosphate synthase small subunit
MEAVLALEDGRVFRGRAFGAPGERSGEVVFNTSMTGYQEVLTDPSYKGQIIVMTCPEIGNYGTNSLDQESDRAHLEGFVVREVSLRSSNWRANQALPEYLRERGIPGISEVDTRALTRHIRTRGAMRAVLSSVDRDAASLVQKAQEAPAIGARDLVARVTCERTYPWNAARDVRWGTEFGATPGERRPLCVTYDFGVKRKILRLLHESGFQVRVVPASLSAADALALEPSAVFLSNGPGDPTVPSYAIDAVRELIGKLPIFGICLGHQIAALALGARTFKLKFGHHGANHPVQELRTGTVAVTSQNHGYAVDPDSLPAGAEATHINLNDGTCEGFVFEEARLLAIQFHPESSPGPHDSLRLFTHFSTMATGTNPVVRSMPEDER